MTPNERTAAEERDVGRFWMVIALAATATLVAALAGLVLGIADLDNGSTSDGLFRGIAAAAGLSTGALFGAAMVLDRPAPHEMLIRTAAVGVCRSDLHSSRGTTP